MNKEIDKPKENLMSSDKRDPGFFNIDNELIDNYQLSDTAFYIYCKLIRHSGIQSYVSVKELSKKLKRGKSTIINQIQDLINKGLIEKSNLKSGSGAIIYNILPVKKELDEI